MIEAREMEGCKNGAIRSDRTTTPVYLMQRLRGVAKLERYGAALAAGAVSILAMPPFHFWPVLWLTLPLLGMLVDVAAEAPNVSSRWAPWRRWPMGRGAEIGWLFGFGYHVAGLYWIGEAFLVEAEVFAWLLPFAVTFLPAGLALFTAVAAAFSQLPLNQTAFQRAAMMAVGFGVTEWLRGHILTGFPWNILGTALTYPLPLLQGVSVLGIYGLTIVAVLVFAGPFALVRETACTGSALRRRLATALGLAVIPLATIWGAGAWRLAALPKTVTEQQRPTVRIVQLSIPQRERMQAHNQRRIFDEHLAASLTAPDGHIDNAVGINLIIWPEAAMPFVPLAQPVALQAIGTMLPPGTQLASGALRVETDAQNGARKVYNSLLVFKSQPNAFGDNDSRGALAASYDKIHLVPFGEYLPMQTLLELLGLQQITRERGGFTAGSGPRKSMSLPNFGQVLPLICYEAIFPMTLFKPGERPDLLLTVTNDGWFGTMTGPRQHYHQARIRAVELGIPMVRASSNGISSLLDGNGRELGRLELNAVGTLDVSPPAALPATIYARFGDGLFWLLVVSVAVGLVLYQLSDRSPHL